MTLWSLVQVTAQLLLLLLLLLLLQLLLLLLLLSHAVPAHAGYAAHAAARSAAALTFLPAPGSCLTQCFERC